MRIGRLSFIAEHDTRDNLFTPTRGHVVEAEAVVARTALGGTSDHEQFNLSGFDWTPLSRQWLLGVRADLKMSRGDVPFFAKPFVFMRGVPALRHQEDNAAALDAELR